MVYSIFHSEQLHKRLMYATMAEPHTVVYEANLVFILTYWGIWTIMVYGSDLQSGGSSPLWGHEGAPQQIVRKMEKKMQIHK